MHLQFAVCCASCYRGNSESKDMLFLKGDRSIAAANSQKNLDKGERYEFLKYADCVMLSACSRRHLVLTRQDTANRNVLQMRENE